METLTGEKVLIDLGGLNALHEDALRYRRLRSIATCRALHRDGPGAIADFRPPPGLPGAVVR